MVQIKLDIKSPNAQDTKNPNEQKSAKDVNSQEIEPEIKDCPEDDIEKNNTLCGWRKIDTFLVVIALFAVTFGTICAFSTFGRWYSNDDHLSSGNFVQTKCKIEEINVEGRPMQCNQRENGEWCNKKHRAKSEDGGFKINEAIFTPCMQVKVSFKLIPLHQLKSAMYMDDREFAVFQQRLNRAEVSMSPDMMEDLEDEEKGEQQTSLLHKDFIEEENFPDCEENFCNDNDNDTAKDFDTVKGELDGMKQKGVFVECWYNSKQPDQVFRYPPGLHMLLRQRRFHSLWWPMTITGICFLVLIFRRIYAVCCYVCGPDDDDEAINDESSEEKKVEDSENNDEYDSNYIKYVTSPEKNGLPDVEEKVQYLSINETATPALMREDKSAAVNDLKTKEIYKVEVRPLAQLSDPEAAETNSNI